MVEPFLRYLKPSLPLMTLAGVMGLISGLGITGLLMVTNRALTLEGGVPWPLLALFFGLCALVLIGDVVSDILLNVVGQRIVAGLRKDLCARILCASIAQIEAQRAHRLIATLHQDVSAVTQLFLNLPRAVIAVPLLISCLVYLAVLSSKLLLLILAVVGIGTGIHLLAHGRAMRSFRAARQAVDTLQKHYRALTEGAKELKINRVRRARFFHDQLSGSIEGVREMTVQANNVHAVADAAGSLLFFALIGAVLALAGSVGDLDKAAVGGFVLVLLYMRGPINQVVSILPIIANARVSLANIRQITEHFAESEPSLRIRAEGTAHAGFEKIELRQVSYRYQASDAADSFGLGPLDLTLRRGEILFITGGNGSGKTTLIKILLGIYYAHGGQILLDGRPVEQDELDDYRQMFSVVFSDYYLFDDMVAAAAPAADGIQLYIERLGLARKVTISDGAFSTTDLSSGQRKRLALVHAYAEARPIVVFDEWAADQDPEFREAFYRELLPELKRSGKTVVAISHDDRYFECADRCLRLDSGRLSEPALAAVAGGAVRSLLP